ncbi:hypothetical protein K438DRAFT_2019623 [Mycena galopus ATCC 62051]|nr:hypothetical protein K438DRAFT_2019623 [Mycena galopus ATCC 62051]
MKFASCFAVLSLGHFAVASPTRPDSAAMAAPSTVPDVAVVPLTLSAVFDTLEEVIVGLTPTPDALVAAAVPEGQLPSASVIPSLTLVSEKLTAALNTMSAQLAANPPGDITIADEVLDDLNTALNTLVPSSAWTQLFICFLAWLVSAQWSARWWRV